MANLPAILLAVKNLHLSKQRLQGFLSGEQRQALAKAMLEDMLKSLKQSLCAQQIFIVSKDLQVEALSRQYKVNFLAEPNACQDLNSALYYGLSKLGRYEKVLILHADLPLVDACEIDQLCQQSQLSIVPDRHDLGSNALLVNSVPEIGLFFGEESFKKHCQEAENKQVNINILKHLPSLRLDVDRPSDIQELLKYLATSSQTWRCLQQQGLN